MEPSRGAGWGMTGMVTTEWGRWRRVAGASLVVGEAKLSDWISDLKTDSFHLGLSSGDEGDAPSTRRTSVGASRGGRGGWDSRGSFPRSRMSGGEFSGDRRGGFERRGRVMSSDQDDDDFSSSRGRRGRGERSSGLVRRGGRGNGFDEEAAFRSPRGQPSQRGRGSGVARRGGKYSDFDRDGGDGDTGFGSSREGRGASGQLSGWSHRRGRVTDLDDDEDSDDDLVGFGDRDGKRHHGCRRGGREDTVGFRRGRGRRDLGLSWKGGSYSDLGDYDGDIGLGSSRGRRDRDGRMSGLSWRRGRGSDLDDDEDDDASPDGFEGSSDDDEAGEVDEDDEPSGFEDDLFGDEGVKEDVGLITSNKSGSSMSAKDEPAKHESVQGRRSTRGGVSYLSQKR
ncbi:unnamed protein product [Miscanthus lutarioriparius]|uniref:Uncharacterized protein n=1 Tax=Miscanthus lutarioriparius TaxID=422564 RepID=A0A811SEY0_9POAL|nr:unnamed protein product [Miscanthus lutarioriparius]